MQFIKDIWLEFKTSYRKISLVDRLLMLFMLILFLYTAVNLFTAAAVSQDTSPVDVIVRTSAAAVFGYFVSSNFLKKDSPACYNKIQMTIVFVIGLASLILLFIAGRLGDITPEITATVSQLRDFAAACVAYLVSCGKAQ